MQTINKHLPTYTGCIVCGEKSVNPNTLNIRFRITGEGVETEFISNEKQEGYRGIVHGGIIASILDETIGWAVAVERKKFFMTVDLNIRYLKSLPVGKKVIIKGKALSCKRRTATGEGFVVDDDGIMYATASARFFLMPDDEAAIVNGYLTFQENDIDILSSGSEEV